jgi:DNA polymerase II large subunit
LRLSKGNFNDIPDCRLAVKRDTIEIKRIVQIDEYLMRLIGYYLAEGHSRKSDKGFYQVSFACPEKEISEDIYHCISRTFGIKPGRNDIGVTISSRLAYTVFSEILELGSNAHDKRIPYRLLSLPKTKISKLLSSYFSGDGSVEKGRLHISCCSANEGLLRDIGFLLSRFGIFYRLREETRKAGGILSQFYIRKGRALPEFTSYTLSIRSSYAKVFHDEIGFSLERKQKILFEALPLERKPRIENSETMFMDPIKEIRHIRSDSPFLYDIEVEDNHTFLMNDLLVSANCDGDEDSIMLLMDVLLNFSYSYLPENRGGRMDAPLVINTNLDPNEVDSEAHCMETGFSYPIEFYKLTQEIPSPKDVKIDVIEKHLDDDPFTIGLTKFSTWVGAPKESRYVQLGEMSEKTDVELKLCKKIRAVDVADVAKRLIDSHLIRDTYGNLRAFARQKFRCVKCNKKYRRPPLLGKCDKCGGRVILTVSRGTIEKYVDLTKTVVDGYVESDYIRQRMELVRKEIESVFENDKVKQFSLSDFA